MTQAENTWPNWHTPPKRPLIRHHWIPVEGKFKTDQCVICGTIRKWEQDQQMYSYFAFWINGAPAKHLGYRAPGCILPNTKLPNT